MFKVQKNIAVVAHDNRKKDIIEWVEWNVHLLLKHKLTCTGTTGKLVEKALRDKLAATPELEMPPDFEIRRLRSGPLGGDQQLGALITEGNIDLIIFFWDPMQPHPHDVDVKALLRIAVLYNIPIACNRSSADFIISSPLMDAEYTPIIKDYAEYLQRDLPVMEDIAAPAASPL
jgi:methylglyoxal synthase